MRRKYGFTLVELLVVIAIIGVLAAILMPVLSRARKKAYAGQCVGNLRQLSIAIDSYSTDFQGYFCWASDSTWATDPAGSGHINWNQCEYDGHQGGDLSDAYASYTVDWVELYTPYTEDALIFRDPAIRKRPDYTFTQVGMTAERNRTFNSHYELNWFLMAAHQNEVKFSDSTVKMQCGRFGYDVSWFFMPNWTYTVKLGAKVDDNIGNFATSTDGGPNIMPTGGDIDWTGPGVRLEGLKRSKLVHGTTNHFLFVDGHVQALAPEVPKRDWFFASPERHWMLHKKDLEEGK